MPALTGILVSVVISLTAIPLVILVTTESALSEPITMMAIGFTLLFCFAMILNFMLPVPTKQTGDDVVEGRGFVYYTCCLFMWASVADLALQSGHLELFGLKKNTLYYERGETYLAAPCGISAQFWNGIMHYIMYMVIIYQIDNGMECRNAAIYWAGSILESQFVVMMGAFTGHFSDQLEYPVWLNIIFIVVPFIVLIKSLGKPRFSSGYVSSHRTSIRLVDVFLCLGLASASLFSLMRGLGALGSEMSFIKNYVASYEPYILEPGKCGKALVLYLALYGIPFQLAAIYGVIAPGCQWLIDFSVFFAAGSLQGTVVYLSYSWYPSSQPEYRIPTKSLDTVLLLNIGMVAIFHAFMFRCLRDPEYFIKEKKKVT